MYARYARYLRNDGVPDIETTRKRLREDCRRRLEAWSDEFDAGTLERALREGVTKGSRPPIDESPFGPGRGDDGPVLVEKTSDIKPFDGFPDDVVDEVLETSLGRGLLGVRAADRRYVGIGTAPEGKSSVL